MRLKTLLYIFCFFISVKALGQQVTGKVTAGDEPLPGVTILVKGTSTGVVSDVDGNYVINNLNTGDVLLFSFIGYITRSVVYNGQSVISIDLEEDITLLDEVVIVTYGRQRNTPVSSIKAKDLKEFPNTDIGQALQGRAAGVNITNGGSPGSQTLVQIRGTNTLGDGTPLYVVDGVFTNSLNSIDPANIESIEILKDAASLAVYGSRGTNGVVIINTKKGSTEGKTAFSFEFSRGHQQFDRRYDVLNTEQYIQYLREINATVGQNGGPDFPIGVVNDDPSFDGNGIDTDWQEAFFRTAPITNFSANISGGTDKARFSVGLSHLNQEGIYIETSFQRTTLNLNSDYKINKFLEFGQTLSLGYNETIFPEIEGGRDPLFNILGAAPYVPVIAANGLFGGHGEGDVNDSRNQIRIQATQDNLTRFGSVIGSVYAKLNLYKGLSFRSQAGLDASLLLQDNERRAFEEDGGRFANPDNFINNTRQTFSQSIFTNTLAYDTSFGKHEVNASVVLEQLRIRLESASVSDNNQISSSIPEVFSPNARATSFSVPENLNSLLLIGGYTYDDRYSFGVSGRRDVSSRFAPENASEWFLSGSFGWNVASESFFNVDFINNLKVRLSYGETGNNRTGNRVNAFLPTLGANFPVSLNDGTAAGISPNNAANGDLRWETQVKQNYGFNLGVLDNKFTLGFDYFNNRSQDLLIPVELPPSAGVPGNSDRGASIVRNVGEVVVDGMEFTLGYSGSSGEFNWDVTANLTTLESTVEALSFTGEPIERARLNPPFDEAINRLAVGLPAFHFFGLVADGVYSTQEQIEAELPNNADAATPVRPGDVRYLDINGDGQITLEDRAVIGDPNPDFTYALNVRAGYKGFDASILLNGVQGVDAFNSNIFFLEGQQNVLNHGTEVLRRFQNEGDITDVPRFRFGSNINNAISSRYVEDASYLRVRNITIGYTLPDSYLEKFGKGTLGKVRVYVQGQNLVTFTNYSGLDPEIAPFYNAQGLVDGLGIDRSAQPRPRTIIGGIQIEF